MIKSIAKKEFLTSYRDRSFISIGIIIFSLLIISGVIGVQNFLQLQEQRSIAQQTVNDQFANSANRHPHRMAHYGSYAFRPKSPLSFMDFGIDAFTGTTVFMEAHRQNSANFSQAQQATSLIRFGEMTIAFVLQILMPLLIIFLCFGAISKERETGTLKMMLSQGLSFQKIAWEKIKGYSLVIASLIYPALLIICLILFIRGNFDWDIATLLRYASFLIIYSCYFFIFIVIAVLISSLFKNSSASLITLLGIWVMFCVIIPKITANIGDQMYPTMTKAQMDAEIHHEVASGIDGHNSADERAEALKQELFEKYDVESLEDLPVNFDGIWMAKGEEQSSQVYSEHFEELTDTFRKQNKISDYASFINPYLAIRNLSMAIAGSDFYHYTDFLRKAEEYRYNQSQKLNNIQATQLNYGDKQTRLSTDTWKEFTPFSYESPGLLWALKNHMVSLMALLFWIFILSTIGSGLFKKSKAA